jgi:cytoskeletal protein CcmA (bactofilin family)
MSSQDEARNARRANLDRSVVVKGEVSGSEDLTIDGRVEGRIDLPDHALTIGPNATIKAAICAREVTVFGAIVGDIMVRDKVELHTGASLDGDLTCGRIVVQEGAHVCGKVETLDQRRPRSDAAPAAGEERAPVLARVV